MLKIKMLNVLNGVCSLRFFICLVVFLIAPFAADAKTSDFVNVMPLDALGESVLSAQGKTSNVKVYRLAILPAFGEKFCLRIEWSGVNAVMILKRLKKVNDASSEKWVLVENKTFKLEDSEFAEFERLVVNSEFYSMPKCDTLVGLDGHQWIMEASRADFYHVVSRWCPNTYKSEERGTQKFVLIFRWAFNRAGVLKDIMSKDKPIFPDALERSDPNGTGLSKESAEKR